MPWPLDLRFMQMAMAAGLVVGISAPLIGAFLVQKRLALMGDGIGHIAFAGVAAGMLLEVWPVWSALVVAVVGALGIELLRRRGIAGDLVLALFFYSGIAAGLVIMSTGGVNPTAVVGILFGGILLLSPADVWVIAGLGAAIVLSVAIAGRAMFAVVLDEESARVAGLPVDALNTMLAILVAVTVVIGMRVVGVLLIAALMVLPVGAAQGIARSFRATLIGGSVVGGASVVIGLTIARALPVAPGGMIVLVAAAAFALTALVTRRRPTSMPHEPAFPGAPPPIRHDHGHHR